MTEVHPTRTEGLSRDSRFRRHDSPVVETVEAAGETVIYHCARDSLHLLDPLGTLLWLSLDGSTSVGEISDDLAEVFGRPPDQVLDDVTGFVAHLEQVHLVERLR